MVCCTLEKVDDHYLDDVSEVCLVQKGGLFDTFHFMSRDLGAERSMC